MRGQCVAKPRPIETVLVTGPLRGGTTIAARNFAIALSLPLKCSATARGPSLFRNIHHQDPKAQILKSLTSQIPRPSRVCRPAWAPGWRGEKLGLHRFDAHPVSIDDGP